MWKEAELDYFGYEPGMLAFDPETGQFAPPWDVSFITMDSVPQVIRDDKFTIADYIAWIVACFRQSYMQLKGLFKPSYRLEALPVSDAVNPVIKFREGCQALGRVLESLVALGPVRSGPKRWYELYSMSVDQVGYDGDFTSQLLLLDDGSREAVNSWLHRLDVGYELAVEPLSSDLFAVKLIDTRSKARIEVSLASVGYGISQVLPIITQSLVSKGALITIEQPELHIHPKLQAELGNLFAEGIKPPYNNQFVIETHSEHLILRLQRLVRTGVLQPQDISVLYVQRGRMGSGSDVIRLRLDEEGDFLDDWPGGFFPERLQELL